MLHIQYNMSGLKQKRDQLAKELRQSNREQIRAGLRTIVLNRFCGNQMPLISTVLQKFCELNHFQLTQHVDQIINVLNFTRFQELQDDEHDEIVTDLFYLIHENIVSGPFLIKFKKNQSPYTASLVAYLSADLQPQEIVYWFNFMCEQDKRLVLLKIEGEACQIMWVINKQLFMYLLQSLKWFSEAAIVYKSMLLNCDQFKKKHIDQSVKYIIQAISYSRQSQNEEVRFALVELMVNILQAYYQIKENNQKVEELANLIKNQLMFNIQIFTNSDVIADLNKLYDLKQNNYLGNDETCIFILNFVSNWITKNQLSLRNDELQYYLNNLFRLFYNHWRSLHLHNKEYRYCSRVMQDLQKLGILAANNVWLIKLKNILK